MKTVREVLKEYCKKKGFGTTDKDLIEVMTEAEQVWSEELDKHRWYIVQNVVVELDGAFIMYEDYIITGDSSMWEMGLEYNLEKARIVERKERTEVYYE